MARSGSKSAASKTRTEQERARLYQARQDWHDGKITRRTRDNVVAGVAGGLLVLATIASQSVHAIVLDNLPEPTTSPSTSITPQPTSTPTPIQTPTPDESEGSDEG